MYSQSHELVKSIKAAWRNLESLEKEAIGSFGQDHPVTENIGYACTYLMNADIEMEENPSESINCNQLEATTLDQIFDVLILIRGEDPASQPDLIDAYQRALLTSSRFYNIHRNTIADACTRRLQLNTDGFLELVKDWFKGDPCPLIATLKSHTPVVYHSDIDDFFTKKRRKP